MRLSQAQCAYLHAADYLPANIRAVISAKAAATSQVSGMTLQVDADFAERARSAFTERLAQVGFDQDYELTGEGVVLEELIDLFLDSS